MEVHRITVACVSLSRTGKILCHSFERGDGTSRNSPLEEVHWSRQASWRRVSSLSAAAATLPGITGSLPSVRRTSLAPLVLFGFCLVLEGKVGGCDDSQESGTRWLKLLQNSQGLCLSKKKNPTKPKLVGSSIVL